MRPDDRPEAVLAEVVVGFAEMTTLSKAYYRQRRRMRRFKDLMPLLIQELLEPPGGVAPEHEHNMLALIGQLFQGWNGHCIFPPNLGVAVAATMLHRQSGVQQEHPLFGPRLQGSIRIRPVRVVAPHLVKDVLE